MTGQLMTFSASKKRDSNFIWTIFLTSTWYRTSKAPNRSRCQPTSRSSQIPRSVFRTLFRKSKPKSMPPSSPLFIFQLPCSLRAHNSQTANICRTWLSRWLRPIRTTRLECTAYLTQYGPPHSGHTATAS